MKKMYKITLNGTTAPYAPKPISVFADNLSDFEKYWFENEKDEERKARYLKSKNGEIITDGIYPGNNGIDSQDYEKYNIVQKIEINDEKAGISVFRDQTISVRNPHDHKILHHFDELTVLKMIASVSGKKFAFYKISGEGYAIKSVSDCGWREPNTENNPFIFKSGKPEIEILMQNGKITNENADKTENFKNIKIETFVWFCIPYSDNFNIDELAINSVLSDVI